MTATTLPRYFARITLLGSSLKHLIESDHASRDYDEAEIMEIKDSIKYAVVTDNASPLYRNPIINTLLHNITKAGSSVIIFRAVGSSLDVCHQKVSVIELLVAVAHHLAVHGLSFEILHRKVKLPSANTDPWVTELFQSAPAQAAPAPGPAQNRSTSPEVVGASPWASRGRSTSPPGMVVAPPWAARDQAVPSTLSVAPVAVPPHVQEQDSDTEAPAAAPTATSIALTVEVGRALDADEEKTIEAWLLANMLGRLLVKNQTFDVSACGGIFSSRIAKVTGIRVSNKLSATPTAVGYSTVFIVRGKPVTPNAPVSAFVPVPVATAPMPEPSNPKSRGPRKQRTVIDATASATHDPSPQKKTSSKPQQTSATPVVNQWRQASVERASSPVEHNVGSASAWSGPKPVAPSMSMPWVPSSSPTDVYASPPWTGRRGSPPR